MSGGFFRGTSADQDTRFSNKMKKLLKSQKFAPELDVMIDTSKVQMDVIKPWVAIRVTELLGFEDEVLINFINGMLEEKNVDGKHVQIQLTGFMEKNTGKFMKELWSLLISAQSNVSGIPQQFLDQKAEETRLKKVESERIAAELQRKRDLDKLVEEERQREKDAAAEAAKIAGGAKGLADNDRDSKHSDDRRTSRGNGILRKSVSKSRSPPGRSYSRRQRSRHSLDSSLSRSPVRSPLRRRADSRSVSRSPRRRRRSISRNRPSRVSRVVHSPVRRSYSRSPIRRRKSPPTYRSPVRRRYASRSPPPRRSPSYSLSPVPRRRARSPYRRSRADIRKEYWSPERVDRPRVREGRSSVSPVFRGSELSPKPSVTNRRPTGFGVKASPVDGDDEELGTDRDARGSMGDKRAFRDEEEKKTRASDREARKVSEERRLYSDVKERKVGSDRVFRNKKEKWSHDGLNDENEESRRGGRDVVEERSQKNELENRRTELDRSARETREKWAHNDSQEWQREVTRGMGGVSGEKRPHSVIERNTDVDRVGRYNLVEDRFDNDMGRRLEDRIGGSGKRDMDMRREDRNYSDWRDRSTGRERSPFSEKQQASKDTRRARKTVELSQSPGKERREDHGRRSIALDNNDSDSLKEKFLKKSRIQEAKDGGATREDDQDDLSPRETEEKRKEEKRRRKEEKRLRRDERHKRKREKQRRKDEKRAMKTEADNGEEKRRSPEGKEHSDEEHSEYDQKQLEDKLRHEALESLRAKKAISH
ncbi:uncharacterized protein [Physcomitrium patens]|uniref:uncharacterized protein isoform X3 n=1 Tax=Physcomitrium patens TaxID=3218 RepID=UPI00024AD663|nr:serine/arginine repetitive matrix protein 1-like isoform X3 [Physcomitrium patens]|eukprot:XP_024386347.1 serine/arginine repetitive matrix protein 1-like isoform X3 [Physcomitrella patens]